jgi:polar amino acid transport system substrate-binding protein
MQRLASLLMLALLPLVCVAQKRVEVWTYHVSPPFIIDETRGLSRALVTLLNVDPRNGGRFHFGLRPLPRKRVDQRLAAPLPERRADRPGSLVAAAAA